MTGKCFLQSTVAVEGGYVVIAHPPPATVCVGAAQALQIPCARDADTVPSKRTIDEVGAASRGDCWRRAWLCAAYQVCSLVRCVRACVCVADWTLARSRLLFSTTKLGVIATVGAVTFAVFELNMGRW